MLNDVGVSTERPPGSTENRRQEEDLSGCVGLLTAKRGAASSSEAEFHAPVAIDGKVVVPGPTTVDRTFKQYRCIGGWGSLRPPCGCTGALEGIRPRGLPPRPRFGIELSHARGRIRRQDQHAAAEVGDVPSEP